MTVAAPALLIGLTICACTASERDRTLTHRPIEPERRAETRGSLGVLSPSEESQQTEERARQAFEQAVPGTDFKLRFVPIPAGILEEETAKIEIEAFYLLECEVTWDTYDIFLYEKDRDAGLTNDEVDAVTRPSKPYIPPDRGYGHEGYPAIGIAHQAAEAYCQWLSAHTPGKTFRLPTEHEWKYAARAGEAVALDSESLDAVAWTDENADFQTQPVKQKKPNAWGLYDMFGNAAEWVNDVDEGDDPFIRGGHFMNTRDAFDIDMKEYRERSWSMNDPQVPKSPWWLSDGPFVGFRVVCEVESEPGNGTTDTHR